MSKNKVVDLAAYRKDREENPEKYVKKSNDVVVPDDYFQKIQEENKKRKEKEAEERKSKNKKTLSDYRIK